MNTKKLGSYPTASVLITITTALFMIGAFGLFAIHTTTLVDILQRNVEIQVYLERDIDSVSQSQIFENLSKQDFVEIDREGQKPLIKFLSKEAAAKKLAEDIGENFIESLGANPLRDAYLVNIKRNYYSKEKLNQISKQLEAIAGIYEVVYSESVIEKINQNLNTIGLLIMLFASILICVVVLLLHNAIKLALFSQRFLIRSMQLVGATDSFIKKPFLKRAASQGFLGGLIACLLLVVLLYFFNLYLKELKIVQSYLKISFLFSFLLIVGTSICYLSAYFATNRYLRMSLDNLY
ncbi:cell division protein FtsX [Thermoflexibacter ruber]|uniref:Cell division protein FtsX n=1 Tax=Thermoflexibacter ruber TaxID=1003 RepID=A0A1I2IQ55_9BACT|nr:permease-like cell division protein FtsX [Thermoflexibacter ruber]SFF42661.1 cell division transport system permease protein [Thermoflexibacter ruber]